MEGLELPSDTVSKGGFVPEGLDTEDERKEHQAINAMNDSACGSLFGSEESCSKCQENDYRTDDFDPGSDSLDCDQDDQFSDSEDELTEDNITLNGTLQDSSESQEISDHSMIESHNSQDPVTDQLHINDSKDPEILKEEENSAKQGCDSSNGVIVDKKSDNKSDVNKEEANVKVLTAATPITPNAIDKPENLKDNPLQKEETSRIDSTKSKTNDERNQSTPIIKNANPETEKVTGKSKESPLNLKKRNSLLKKCKKLGLKNQNEEFVIQIFESKRKINTLADAIEKNDSQNNDNHPKCENQPSIQIVEENIAILEPYSQSSCEDKTLVQSEAQNAKELEKDTVKQQDLSSSEKSTSKNVHSSENSKSAPSEKQTAAVSQESSQSGASDAPKSPVVSDLPSPDSGHVPDVSTSSEPSPKEVKKSTPPLAFTVDLNSTPAETTSSGTPTKKLDISSSISQWIPKHRRNTSLTKVDENKRVEEERSVEKPPLGRQRSGTVGASSLGILKRGAAGYNSEGYFSSDQDEESLRKAELISSPKPIREADESAHLSRPSQQSSPRDISLRKNSGKTEGRSCCKEIERKPSASELTRNSSKKDKKMVSNGTKSISTVPMPSADVLKDDNDDLSDAGTYTIDKDSPSAEEELARTDIDEVFGVGHGGRPVTVPGAKSQEDEWTSASESVPVISRRSPNWIQQWAAQVAEQTKPPLDPCRSAPKSFNSSASESDQRPRRKLPTPPSQFKQNHSDSQRHRARIERTNSDSIRIPSFESHESGADSDFDTSASYAFHDEVLSASLRNKLRLNGITGKPNSPSCPSYDPKSPRRADAKTLERHITKEDYGIYDEVREEHGTLSDTSSETSEPYKHSSRSSDNKNPPLKFNRAFSLRRARLGIEESTPANRPTEKKKLDRPSSGGSTKNGRKVSTGSIRSNMTESTTNSVPKKGKTGNRKQAARSSSTLSSKEVDFQNWKRRKNYDPMKAAAEAKKKQMEKKSTNGESVPVSRYAQRSPSPSASLHRSASFHGTDSSVSNARWPRRSARHLHYPSEDDGPNSLEEEVGPHPSPCHGSPLHRSPTSPRQLSLPPTKQILNMRNRRSSLGYSEDEQQSLPSSRKICLEENLEGKKSATASPRGPPSSVSGSTGRPKTKMEALDNLVISTIHSLSVKVRTTSESLIEKLKSQYDEEGDRAALLDEVLSHLSESDISMTGQTRSTSRELAGILRNLKTIEHALEVIDRVIIVGDEDQDDEDELDYVPREWVEESDY